MKMERRDFLKGAAIGAIGMVPLGMLSSCSPADSNEANADANEQATTTTTSQVITEDGRLLSLAEVNALRQEFIDSQTDYICEDGTVIPALWVKLRALIHTTGMGIGDKLTDDSFEWLMMDFTEEQAEAYLEMPWGVHFTATDYAYKTGRDEDECSAFCEEMGDRGLLHRSYKATVPYYYTLPEIHGIWEYGQNKFSLEYIMAHRQMRPTPWEYFWNAGTPNYYAMPVSRDVVEGGEILLYDDYEKIIERNEIFAKCKCICARQMEFLGTKDDCAHPTEKCMALGEAAEFAIENGDGIQITKEEALEYLKRNVEMGLVLQSCFSRETGSICSCHSDCCGFLKSMVALGDDFPKENASGMVSHYRLKFDQESCLKCGTCEDRCPLVTITMNEEGFPQIGGNCIACGQCAYVCPAEARKLVQKEGEPFSLPEDYLDDANTKAEYRFRNGLIMQGKEA